MSESIYLADIRKRYEKRWQIGYGGGKISESEATLLSIITRIAKSIISANFMVLDIGCGSGEILHRLGSEGQLVGADFSRNALTIASRRKESPLDLILADAYMLPFRHRTFDLIIAKELIEHLENPKKFLGEVKLFLKKNANALFIVPNVCNLRRRTQMLLGLGFFDLKEHIWHFTASSFRETLEKNGLKVVHIRGDQVIVPLLWRITPQTLRILMAKLRPSFADHIICVCKKC